MVQLTSKTNGLIKDAARRGDSDGAVDFRGSPRDAGGFRGDKQAVRAAWPPGDGENHRLMGGGKGFYSSLFLFSGVAMAMRCTPISAPCGEKPHRAFWVSGRFALLLPLALFAVALLAGCSAKRAAGPPTPYITDSRALTFTMGGGFDDIFAAKRDIEVHADRDLKSPVVFTLRPGELFYAHKGIGINPEPTLLRVIKDTSLWDHESKGITVNGGETVHFLYGFSYEDGDSALVWYRGKIYEADPYDDSFAPTPYQARYLGEDTESPVDTLQEWVYAENTSGAKGWFTFPQDFISDYFEEYVLTESFADHDWLVLRPGESSLATHWDKDGTLSLSINMVREAHPGPWLLPEARQSRLLLSYPAAPPLIVTCPEADQAASCQMYAFKLTQIDEGRGSFHAEYQLIKVARPNAVFIGQDWMILTCHTGVDIYDWSSDCTSSVAEFHGDPELTVVDLHHGKSHRIIKGSESHARPPLFLVPGPGQTLPENLTWVSDSPVQYFKETLAITPQGFAVEVAFPENKAPGTRHRLHVALPSMEITLEPR